MSLNAHVGEAEWVKRFSERRRRTRHLAMLTLKVLAKYGKRSLYGIRKRLKEDHNERLEHSDILRMVRDLERRRLVSFVGERGPRRAKFYDITLWGLAFCSAAGYLLPEDFYAYLSSRSRGAAAILEIFNPPEGFAETLLQFTFIIQLPAVGKVNEKSLQEAEEAIIKQFETTLLIMFAHSLYEKKIGRGELERLSEDKRKAIREMEKEYLRTVAAVVQTAQEVAIAFREMAMLNCQKNVDEKNLVGSLLTRK